MTADERARLAVELDDARAELHEAQRVVALLAEYQDEGVGRVCGAVAVARLVIERDLAARRVESWVAVLDRLRSEARRVGLFA